MMILQNPIPPTPPMGPQFDPNLIFMNDGGPPTVLLIVIAALTAMTIVLWPIMRAFGRRLEGKGNADSALRAEVEQLHTRLADMDSLHARVLELEERVDFTERLLAQVQNPARLGVPTEEGGR
jgi:Tfp pilus assembly protein PilO